MVDANDSDEIRSLLSSSWQMCQAGAQHAAHAMALQAVERLLDRVELLEQLLVATNPEACRLIGIMAGVGEKGEA